MLAFASVNHILYAIVNHEHLVSEWSKFAQQPPVYSVGKNLHGMFETLASLGIMGA